jgi:hypothetical protein
MDARFWDERYGEDGFAYGDQPNDFLREQVSALTPGDAIHRCAPVCSARPCQPCVLVGCWWSRCSWSESCRGWIWASCGNVRALGGKPLRDVVMRVHS